jgi:hypothetical protein
MHDPSLKHGHELDQVYASCDMNIGHGHELDKFYNYASNPIYILDVGPCHVEKPNYYFFVKNDVQVLQMHFFKKKLGLRL